MADLFVDAEVEFVDSHTEGEPTRVVLTGGPDLGRGSVFQQREVFRTRHDRFRSRVVNEPRGSDILVGALLGSSPRPDCVASVIFFNNVGFLGMCGHGAIGVITTLADLGRIEPGEHRLETPVGVIAATLHGDGRVSIENVPSYRQATGVRVDVPGWRTLVGDVAWGGNWFYLVDDHGLPLEPASVRELESRTRATLAALAAQQITGPGGEPIDHVELSGPGEAIGADSRNFVMCPGGSYDRSPCGTGTSAKLACLAAEGRLAPGRVWRQGGVLGTVFEASYQWTTDGRIVPTITGRAYVCSRGRLVVQRGDPFAEGIRL